MRHPSVMPMLERCVVQVLEAHGQVDRATGLAPHLALAVGPLAGTGSTRESLVLSLEAVCLQALPAFSM